MSRQHPWPYAMGNRILISIAVTEILDHCQNLLDDPHRCSLTLGLYRIIMFFKLLGIVEDQYTFSCDFQVILNKS